MLDRSTGDATERTDPWFQGGVSHIHIADKASAVMQQCVDAVLAAGKGIVGDRYAERLGTYSARHHIDRQVTLIESEVLDALQRDHHVALLPNEHRRNITTVGVPIGHLVGRYFRVGECVLYGGRLNVPCKYLETLLGKPVFRPLVHRSGLNARIVVGGTVRPGDPIELVDSATLDPELVARNEQTPVEPAPEVD